jgi:hypothetical protein
MAARDARAVSEFSQSQLLPKDGSLSGRAKTFRLFSLFGESGARVAMVQAVEIQLQRKFSPISTHRTTFLGSLFQ